MRLLLLIVVALLLVLGSVIRQPKKDAIDLIPLVEDSKSSTKNELSPKVADSSSLTSPSSSKILPSSYHVYQTFNNCGPAALAMALSHYGIVTTQQELGLALRPYQNSLGDNDDKSVTMEELAHKSKEYGFIPYFRPNGSIELVKQLITYDIPVLTKTWLTENEDIGHFRVIKGYDDSTQSLLQDDSYQGPNIWYRYDAFNNLWKKFNYEFLILVPPDKLTTVKLILGELEDEDNAWSMAVSNAQEEMKLKPDVTAHFNLVVALYRSKRYDEAIAEYEKIKTQLPMRTLWYQTEPIKAYYEVGQYATVFELTDTILTTGNRAFSELYLLRGHSYLNQKDIKNAQREFELAKYYNANLLEAQVALDTLKETSLE